MLKALLNFNQKLNQDKVWKQKIDTRPVLLYKYDCNLLLVGVNINKATVYGFQNCMYHCHFPLCFRGGSNLNQFLSQKSAGNVVTARAFQVRVLNRCCRLLSGIPDFFRPVFARGRCRISPSRFLAECCKRQLNQVSLVLLYFRLSAFLICIEFVYLYFPVLFCLSVSVK